MNIFDNASSATEGFAKMSSDNADRFKGFADIYENSRPKMPDTVSEILKMYLGDYPDICVDLGSGTGLSSRTLAKKCKKVYGIEPSDDMRSEAEKHTMDNIEYKKAFSDNTGLPDGFADAVICSQSFHWMEPISTLKEVSRILKRKGIFATVDNDWPAVCNKEAEEEYCRLFKKVRMLEKNNSEIAESFIRRNKENHLENIEKSGLFDYSREIVFASEEKCDADRFFGIAMGQGSLQAVLKHCPQEINKELSVFKENIYRIFDGKKTDILFCYRMRIGIRL